MSTPNAYSYQPLTNDPTRPEKNQNLRLIHLKSATEKTDPLACRIELVNTDYDNKYEAVSWCWSHEPRVHDLRVEELRDDSIETVSVIKLPKTLARALRTLRRKTKSRPLWIDLICINQRDLKERNEQVSMMDTIYGKAYNVCIWLDEMLSSSEDSSIQGERRRYPINGSEEESSDEDADNSASRDEKKKAAAYDKAAEQDKKAIKFIKDEVLGLWRFDDLCKNKAKAEDWVALLSLMRKPWFSRRWVVQEIALAQKAKVYTAKASIDWRDFCDAVSLFVEVEDATRRLTEIMQQHEVYHHVPEFFEDLSALGASMLVQATSNLFRRDATDGVRDSQKSMEYLISALPAFDVTDPRDAVYSLLAVSKDTQPIAAHQKWSLPLLQHILEKDRRRNLTKQTYRVDYGKKVVDVFQEFVSFSISRAIATDSTRALDIICRPWAPNPSSKSENEKLPSWIMGPDEAPFGIYLHPTLGRRMGRLNADPLVGLPDENRPYRAAESKGVDKSKLKFKTCNSFYSLFVEGFKLDTVTKVESASQNGQIPWDWITAAGWEDTEFQPPPEEFWRTIVGDRSQYGRNAPPFFERACHEAIRKQQRGGTIDTRKLITEGRCSIVAAFLRRVQAVIWNRQLARSSRLNKLCIIPKSAQPEDMICILYGCSVPVILRPHFKTDEEVEDEIRSDEKESKKPREEAARYIIKLLRKRQEERERRENEEGQGRRKRRRVHTYQELQSIEQTNEKEPPWMDTETPIQKQTRWEKRIEEERQIRETEEAMLEEKIVEARRIPKEDERRMYFEYIGPCYVHNMMNGEAIEAQNVLHIGVQVFELH
jgi:Heterokaryon incompatibility protein (HET)